ncbi:methyl-accepting chemotaxis protein [Trinickia acidisoli]|uniref:methyl-accepting chemotaxis protein n=1 Tax=Trinickia acidisoli TaxID=2767482 RepID=UPI001A8C6C0E|nr:methyl-accepting chemotaxis protein [Trinickia acidisoli]
MKVANLSIARKLYTAFGIVIAVLVILGVTFYSFFSSVTSANDLNIHTYQVIGETRLLTESMLNMETGLRGYAIVGDDAMLGPYRAGTDSFKQHLATIRNLTSDEPQQQERLRKLETQESQWVSSFADNLLAKRKSVLSVSMTMDQFVDAFKGDTGEAQMAAMRATLAEIVGSELSLLSVRAVEVDSLQMKTKVVLIGGTLLAIALSLVFATWISRLIASPLRDAVTHAEAIAAGDLTRTITSRTTDEVGALMRAFSGMQGKLASVISAIKTSTDSITVAAGEVRAGNADLSSRTEQQAASLEETASSMEELTATVKQNADNARQASALASNASEVADKGNDAVGRVVTTMSGINDSSSKIGEITGIIEGIAFQTNILALNAAVEAARAGEQGRGFAVVASEVRSLAQRSSAAAKEIKELIGASIDKIRGGMTEVEEAGRTMSEVTVAIGRVTGIMGEIAAASDEQSRGIEQVNQAITQMDQVTQQNASLVEQAAAAAQSLEDQGQELGRAVSTFRIATSGTVFASARP